MGLVTQDAAPQQAVEQHGRRRQNRDQPHEQFHKTDNSFVIKGSTSVGILRRPGNGNPYHFNTLTSSRLKVDLPRYIEITSARPMAASEAATAMMKRVKI